MTTASSAIKILVNACVLLLLLGCVPGKESLTVLKILTTGNYNETTPPKLVEVGNCSGFPDYKTEQCTAGTENNFSLTIGISIGREKESIIGLNEVDKIFSFDPSVSQAFGFFRSNTQSLALD